MDTRNSVSWRWELKERRGHTVESYILVGEETLRDGFTLGKTMKSTRGYTKVLMGRLRRAPSTMAHNGKQSKCIGGFQGGSWSMWLMEGRVLMKVILWVVASLYGVNRYDSGRYIVYLERRREESKKSSKITVHWDHSGISCQNCPTAPHRHTRTQHTHTHTHM